MQYIKMILDWIAGLSPDSLEDRCLVKARLRYHAFAFVMLVSAALSGVGAAYFVFYVFKSVGVSVAAGAFWAVAIFLCERFLVLSMDETLTLRNALFGLLRVAFAFLIASTAVIALELRFYDTEVVERISAKAAVRINAAAEELTTFYARDRKDLNDRKAALQAELSGKQSQCDAALQKWHNELRGVSGAGTSGMEGAGPWAHLAADEYTLCKAGYDELVLATAPKTAEIDGKLKKIQDEYDRRYGERVERINAATGLLARIEAFEDIVSEHPTLWNKTTTLWLLLCVFEALPVLGKLTFPRRLSREEADALDDLVKKEGIRRDLDLLKRLTESKSEAAMILHGEELARGCGVESLDSAAARYKKAGPSSKEYDDFLAARISELGSYRKGRG